MKWSLNAYLLLIYCIQSLHRLNDLLFKILKDLGKSLYSYEFEKCIWFQDTYLNETLKYEYKISYRFAIYLQINSYYLSAANTHAHKELKQYNYDKYKDEEIRIAKRDNLKI